MREKFSPLVTKLGIAAAAIMISQAVTPTSAQAPANSTMAAAVAPTTSWGEPDLQGIWTVEADTPLQRPAKYESQEFFTGPQRAELDQKRATLLARDRGTERGTEADVAGAYNSVFLSVKRVGARTSLIVDPPAATQNEDFCTLAASLGPSGLARLGQGSPACRSPLAPIR
jgi:hypothetical protein